MSRPSVVTVANEQVPIATVCRMLGVDLPEGYLGRSRKVRCPFGELYHSDRGVSPAMRVYPDTNSVYCFSCSAYWTPVTLAAKAMDVDPRTAAVRLLDRIGHKPLDLSALWQQVLTYEPELDRALLADALKTYCRRIDPQWSRKQFDSPVAAVLSRCLALLDLVHSTEDVRLWLRQCKAAMSRTLHAGSLSLSGKCDVLLRTLPDTGGTTNAEEADPLGGADS